MLKMLYKPPPFELLPFQWDMIEKAIESKSLIIGADTGMGKTIISIFTMCYVIENNICDHIILEVEKNKFSEWEDDLAKYSNLSVGLLNGSPATRKSVILSRPQVLLGVYETVRNEAAAKMSVKSGKRMVKRWVPQTLTETFKNSRVFIVGDEISAKIGANRQSAMYKAHEIMFKEFRKSGLKVLGLSATAVNRDPEGFFNLARLLDPAAAGTVAEFEDEHVIRDRFNNPILFKNQDETDTPPGKKSLKNKIGHLVIYKRKSDFDVKYLFPEIITQVEYVKMGSDQTKFYNVLKKKAQSATAFEAAQYFSAMRQIAGHPQSLIRSVDNAIEAKRDLPMIANSLIQTLGRDKITKVGSTKLDRLVEIIQENPREQFVVFTFYGQSILPIIQERFQKEGISCTVNHGGLTHKDRKESQNNFRKNFVQVFLTSDAGARGINLPTAGIVINYELPLTYSIWWQRINRANRLDSKLRTTKVIDLITENTIEEGIVEIGLKRHAYSDILLPDTEDGSDYLSAETRREILNFTKENSG